MGLVFSRARPSKALQAKEAHFDFGAECVVEDQVVVGKQVSLNDVAHDPMRDVHNEWKVVPGMNINYWVDQGFSVRLYAPGDCVWMSRPRSSTM